MRLTLRQDLFGSGKQATGKNDNRSRSISGFDVLGSGKLYQLLPRCQLGPIALNR